MKWFTLVNHAKLSNLVAFHDAHCNIFPEISFHFAWTNEIKSDLRQTMHSLCGLTLQAVRKAKRDSSSGQIGGMILLLVPLAKVWLKVFRPVVIQSYDWADAECISKPFILHVLTFVLATACLSRLNLLYCHLVIFCDCGVGSRRFYIFSEYLERKRFWECFKSSLRVLKGRPCLWQEVK